MNNPKDEELRDKINAIFCDDALGNIKTEDLIRLEKETLIIIQDSNKELIERIIGSLPPKVNRFPNDYDEDEGTD